MDRSCITTIVSSHSDFLNWIIMTYYHRPIIPLTLAMIAGILLGEIIPDQRLAAWCLAATCGVCLVFFILRKKSPVILPIILFVCLGYLLIQPWMAPRLPSEHIRFFATGHKALITGVIETVPVAAGFRQSFIIQTEALGGESSRKKVTGKLRVSLSGREPLLNVGDRISFIGRIKPIRSFRNPGGFDYNRYMALKGIWASATGQGQSVKVRERSIPVGLEVVISPVRKSVASLIEEVSPGDTGDILKALLLGDKASVSDSLREDFQRTGIGHLLAISGLHVGLTATVVFFIFSRGFGFLPGLLRRAWTKKSAVVPALLAVWYYGLLAGMSPSTQRAVIMVTVFLATFFLERPQDTLNSVAVAALTILIVQPPSLFAVSFQLSFAAVVTIVLGLSLISGRDRLSSEGVWRTLLRRITAALSVSLAAILGTLPLVLYYFNETSLVGILSNLVFIPIIGFGVVPLGLFSIFVYPLNASLAAWGLKLCGIILSKVLPLVHLTALLPFASVKTVTPSCIEIILYYCLLAAGGCLVHAHISNRRDEIPKRSISRQGGLRFAVVVVAIAVAGIVLDSLYWSYQRFWSKQMRVTIVDVGHGSAGVVEMPGGEVLLLDGGGFSDNASFDVGYRIVAPLLWRKKIRTVRTAFLSHPDSDHLNGLIYISRHFHVARILSNNEPAETRGYATLMSVVREKGIEMPDFNRLPRSWSMGKADVEVLYPFSGFKGKDGTGLSRDRNNNSLVVRITFEGVSFIFPGDIMSAGERELVATSGGRLSSRVLVAPHHGRRSSSTRLFLEAVKPEIIVASTGWNNRFGALTPDVRDRYEQLDARILTTAEHGAVTFITEGGRVRVKTEREE